MVVAASIEPLADRGGRGRRSGLAVGGACVLAVMAAVSAAQVPTWRDAVAMWENCLRVDPGGTIASCGLAENLAKRGEYARALEHYERALRAFPGTARILGNLANLLATCPREELCDYDRAVQLAQRAFEADPKYMPVLALARTNRAQFHAKAGRFEQAIRDYDEVLDLFPIYLPPLVQLSKLMATCPTESLRNPTRAIQLAERACELAGPADVEARIALAVAYAAARRFDDAMRTMDQAIALARTAGNDALSAELEQQSAPWKKSAGTH